MRKKIKDFHRKRPYVDPLINLFLGAAISTLLSDFYSKIQQGESFLDIRIIGPSIIGLIITAIYFGLFSSFALGKYNTKVLEAFEDKSAEMVSTIDKNSPDELFSFMESWNDMMRKL